MHISDKGICVILRQLEWARACEYDWDLEDALEERCTGRKTTGDSGMEVEGRTRCARVTLYVLRTKSSFGMTGNEERGTAGGWARCRESDARGRGAKLGR